MGAVALLERRADHPAEAREEARAVVLGAVRVVAPGDLPGDHPRRSRTFQPRTVARSMSRQILRS